jgi:hypothetical protein
MPISALILSAVILIGVIASDFGRRAVTRSRLRRPLIIAGVAGGAYLTAFASSGAGLAIEVAGVAAGALLGLFAATFMKVEHDTTNGEVFTRTGLPYVGTWVATVAVRLTFIYGANNWFSGSLDSWMRTNHITGDALTDALILMALAMTVARTLSLIVRSHPSSAGRFGTIVTSGTVA